MKQADKKLLIKDLCARLPYGVVIQEKCVEQDETFLPNKERDRLVSIDAHTGLLTTNCGSWYYLDEIKPYLFPMSSMTKAQKKKYYSLADDVTIKPGEGCYFGIKIHCIKLGISDNPHEGLWDYVDVDALDWLHKNHFDYRGLIEKGLAIDATNLNIY